MCLLLRGEDTAWPDESDTTFYSEFLAQSSRHGVDLLIAHLLQESGAWEQLPSSVKTELDRRAKQAIAKEMARANDVTQLGGLLAEAGIRALLIKGAALAYTHYPEPHLRPRVDSDIFIDMADIDKIRDVFSGAGYRLEGWVYKSHQFKALRPGFGGQMIKYDVHWRSSNDARFALVIKHSEALKEAVPISALGGFHAFCGSHALLQACLHRAGNPNHDPDRLIWLYDIHLLISGLPEPELLEFAELAVRSGLQEICLEPVEKCRDYFKTRVSGSALELLTSNPAVRSGRRGYRGSQMALVMDDLRSLAGGRKRMAYCREYLFPPKDYLLQRYGKTQFYWLPVLYFRYVLGGVFEKIVLR